MKLPSFKTVLDYITKEFIMKAIFKHPPLNPLPSREGR
jgi:hypothetical protein